MEYLFDKEERPIKRKVRFHPAGEERTKPQQLEGATFFEVPGKIADTSGLWQWIKQMKPSVQDRLGLGGWMLMGQTVQNRLLPDEFDLHLREAAPPTDSKQERKYDWMDSLVSQVDNWRYAVLSAENVIAPLPWPFVPIEESPAPAAAAANAGFRLRVLDLGDNKTIQSIWGKDSAVKILEREHYKELWERCVKPLFDKDRRVAVLILGNPGIGKTGFLFYVLIILLRAKRKVLLRTKGGSLYYFNPDAAGNYRNSMVASYSDVALDSDCDICFLADGRLPDVPVFLGKALLACTPLRANYKDYEKDAACRKFFLPVWCSRELSLLRQEVFPDRDLDATKGRYKQWGGSPRHVLEFTSDNLTEIVQKMPALPDVVSAASSGAADSNHPSHKALYMRVLGADYARYDLQYASASVRKAIYQKLHKDQVNTLRAFIFFKGTAMRGYGSLKDGILQEHFRHITVQTKQFMIREVFEDLGTKSPGPSMRTFTLGQPVEVWSIEDMNSTVYDSIIWPENPIEETIDALVVTKNATNQDVLQLFQVTVRSGRHDHGLKYTGLLKVMEKFGIPAARTEVYIVTTNELFGDAGWQNWRIKNNNILRDNGIRQRLVGIRQFALDSNA